MGPNSDPQGTACENREPIEKGRSVLIHSCEGVGRVFVQIIFWRPNQ